MGRHARILVGSTRPGAGKTVNAGLTLARPAKDVIAGDDSAAGLGFEVFGDRPFPVFFTEVEHR
jgi:hypothetical protein